MNSDIFTNIAILSVIFAGGSAFAAFIGLILNWWALRENNTTRQLQLLRDSFKSIKETETKLYENYKNADEETKKEWDSLLFNSIEYFAFLVNEKFIKNEKISGFFNDAVVGWYERIFLIHYKNREELNNPKIYPEFKKLYGSIKSKQQSQ